MHRNGKKRRGRTQTRHNRMHDEKIKYSKYSNRKQKMTKLSHQRATAYSHRMKARNCHARKSWKGPTTRQNPRRTTTIKTRLENKTGIKTKKLDCLPERTNQITSLSATEMREPLTPTTQKLEQKKYKTTRTDTNKDYITLRLISPI